MKQLTEVELINHASSLDLTMEKMKNYINFCLFSMILKNLQVTIYQRIKTFFFSVTNVGLTDLGQIFLGESQG